ncbi:MAG TPA: 50S ribosomal protein L22 [Candidatus Absconditabacterales bacterium]|nr:50S ribosomal protein L22 [Candidatus Absconditabacterales bacterium]HNG96741.1 50S ribosomal protein L22 [Candidatus Absconditabacterales bacterium]
MSATVYTATLSYATLSYQKMNLIAKMVRGKTANQALNMLHMTPKKAASILWKVVHSAVANAEHNDNVDAEELVIDRIDVGRGMLLKRMRFVSRSGVHRYFKHRSFVRVVLKQAQ